MKLKSSSIMITFKGKNYNVDVDKLTYVIQKLEDKEIDFKSEEDIKYYLEKCKLYDEWFLENVNRL